MNCFINNFIFISNSLKSFAITSRRNNTLLIQRDA